MLNINKQINKNKDTNKPITDQRNNVLLQGYSRPRYGKRGSVSRFIIQPNVLNFLTRKKSS